jgi:hypothetical protein
MSLSGSFTMQQRSLVIFLYPENPAGTVLFINHIYYRNYKLLCCMVKLPERDILKLKIKRN